MSCDGLQDGPQAGGRELRVLTAAPRAAAGGRRAAAGTSGADTQTAGTGTRFPAGARKQGLFKNAHGAAEEASGGGWLTEGEEEMECSRKK